MFKHKIIEILFRPFPIPIKLWRKILLIIGIVIFPYTSYIAISERYWGLLGSIIYSFMLTGWSLLALLILLKPKLIIRKLFTFFSYLPLILLPILHIPLFYNNL